MRRATIFLMFVLANGCGRDAPTLTGPASPADVMASATDTARVSTRVTAVGLPKVGMVGQSFLPRARLWDDSGAWWDADGDVRWTSGDPTVAAFEGGSAPGETAVLSVLGEGSVTLTVNAEGLSSDLRLFTFDGALASDVVEVESFSVVEFSYETYAGTAERWYYAPLVVLRDRVGAGAEVFGVQFDLPGLGASWYCTAHRVVDAGGSLSLFRETYGDYELSFDTPGLRAGPGDVTAAIYFLDGGGRVGRVLATGSITPGSLPVTYTGRVNSDPWWCGPPYHP